MDDVINIIREEASEDIMKMAGAGEDEDILLKSTLQNAGARFPWLMASWIGGVAALWIIGAFESLLNQTVALAAFIPVIMGRWKCWYADQHDYCPGDCYRSRQSRRSLQSNIQGNPGGNAVRVNLWSTSGSACVFSICGIPFAHLAGDCRGKFYFNFNEYCLFCGIGTSYCSGKTQY